MSDLSELPNWSGRALEAEPQPALQPQAGDYQQAPLPDNHNHNRNGDDRRRSGLALGLVLGLLGGLLLAAVGVGAYWLGSRQNDSVATSDGGQVASPEADGDAVADGTTAGDATADGGGEALTVDAGDSDDAGGDAADTGSTAEGDSTPEADATAAGDEVAVGAADGLLLPPEGYEPTDPNYETRMENATEYAVVRGGRVYLYGFAKTQADLEQSMAVTEAVMGPDGYTVERFVDPDAPVTDGAPIYVDDKVLFDFNSTDLDPGALPIMDLGVSLMLLNPTAEMLIIARSDAVGSEAANLEVSQRRGEAVVDYWVSQGVERSRMTIDARGEADASEDDDAETAALNRSVEFVVSGIPQAG